MKVKIMQRSIYHKIAEIEIDVPKDVDAHDWILDNEDKWVDDLDKANGEAVLGFGFGLDDGMEDKDQEFECRYECPDGFGGHM